MVCMLNRILYYYKPYTSNLHAQMQNIMKCSVSLCATPLPSLFPSTLPSSQLPLSSLPPFPLSLQFTYLNITAFFDFSASSCRWTEGSPHPCYDEETLGEVSSLMEEVQESRRTLKFELENAERL